MRGWRNRESALSEALMTGEGRNDKDLYRVVWERAMDWPSCSSADACAILRPQNEMCGTNALDA